MCTEIRFDVDAKNGRGILVCSSATTAPSSPQTPSWLGKEHAVEWHYIAPDLREDIPVPIPEAASVTITSCLAAAAARATASPITPVLTTRICIQALASSIDEEVRPARYENPLGRKFQCPDIPFQGYQFQGWLFCDLGGPIPAEEVGRQH